MAARRWALPQVLHGATCSQVQLTDLTSGQTLFCLGVCLSRYWEELVDWDQLVGC